MENETLVYRILNALVSNNTSSSKKKHIKTTCTNCSIICYILVKNSTKVCLSNLQNPRKKRVHISYRFLHAQVHLKSTRKTRRGWKIHSCFTWKSNASSASEISNDYLWKKYFKIIRITFGATECHLNAPSFHFAEPKNHSCFYTYIISEVKIDTFQNWYTFDIKTLKRLFFSKTMHTAFDNRLNLSN